MVSPDFGIFQTDNAWLICVSLVQDFQKSGGRGTGAARRSTGTRLVEP